MLKKQVLAKFFAFSYSYHQKIDVTNFMSYLSAIRFEERRLGSLYEEALLSAKYVLLKLDRAALQFCAKTKLV